MASKALHIILAFAVLLSSAGLVVQKHYCQGTLKSTALFVHARECHRPVSSTCPLHQSEENNCCSEESDYQRLEQDQEHLVFAMKTLKAPVQLTPVFFRINLSEPAAERLTPRYLSYRPPIAGGDFQSLFQVFII